MPLTLGQAATDAFSTAANNIGQVMTIELWVLWALGVVASMLPLPATLTAIRLLACAAIPVACWTLTKTDFSAISILATAHALIAGVAAMNSLVGDRFVDGGSYGDERRMLLRAPAQAGVLSPVIGALMVSAALAGPLLLGNRNWVAGGVAVIVGLAVLAAGARSIHQLSQRWIVFVPTGMVLHDLMLLTEPVLFRRTSIERLGAAIAGTPARDLTSGASGLMLECELADPAPLGLRDGAKGASLTDIRRFLISPSRPGALLDEAERRNIRGDQNSKNVLRTNTKGAARKNKPARGQGTRRPEEQERAACQRQGRSPEKQL